MTLTQRLEALAALEEAATPGPWESWDMPLGDGARAFGHRYVRTADGGYPGATLEGRRAIADAALIAAARNALPELLAVARAAGRSAEYLDHLAEYERLNLSHVQCGFEPLKHEALQARAALDALTEKLPDG